MKKLLSSVVVTSIALSAMAADVTQAAINAMKIDKDISTISYTSPIWDDVKFSEIMLYPQSTIKLNDKKANELNANNGAKKAKVAAIYSDNSIAFMIRWADGTINIQRGYKTDTFSDGFAIEIPQDFSDAKKLPYIGMGSADRAVVIYLQKGARGVYEPNGEGNVYYQQNRNQTDLFGADLENFDKKVKERAINDYERTFIAEGFRSMSEIKDSSSKSYARLGYKAKTWSGTLSRPISDEYTNLKDVGAFPVSFAVWDGAKMGRDGIKHLSQWLSVKLEGKEGGSELIAELDDSSVKGDASEGKKVVEAQGCVGCHQVEKTDATNLMGPALYNVGGYSTTAYLRESLLEPSAVVVPGYNRNAHSNYKWYTLEGDKRVSTMTSFKHLSAEEVENVVAYLKTLKAEVE